LIIPNDTGRSPGPTVRESERASNCRQERVLPLGASATAGRRAPPAEIWLVIETAGQRRSAASCTGMPEDGTL